LVERIDQNTEDAYHDLEGAKKEIKEISESVNDTRKLMLKIFFILILFCTFYILLVL
jgi:t-SNARE complex subunit (syntaxin)